MNFESINNNLSKSKVMKEITAIKNQMLTGGNVENEVEILNEILRQLASDEISSEEALKKAKQLASRRQESY